MIKISGKENNDFYQDIKMMRQLYLIFPNRHTLCDQLSWRHYWLIMRIENEKARDYYIQEIIASNWSVKATEELNREIDRDVLGFDYSKAIKNDKLNLKG